MRNEAAEHNETVVLLWVLVSTQAGACKIYIFSREHEAILLNHKQEKWSHGVNEKGYLWCIYLWCIWMKKDMLIFSSHSFFMSLEIYFRENDFCFISLLIKLFGHFSLSTLRISGHFKWEILVNVKNVVVFSVVLCEANKT